MKTQNVIQVLSARHEYLVEKLVNWQGPLHTGKHAYVNAEKVALEHVLHLARQELVARQLRYMEGGQ